MNSIVIFLILIISFGSYAQRNNGNGPRGFIAKLFDNNSCSDRPIQRVRRRMRCGNFSTQIRVSSILVDGNCTSVSKNLVEACKMAKVIALDPKHGFYKRGYYCKPEDFIEFFRPKKQVCDELKSSEQVGQIKIKGECHRVSSRNLVDACKLGKVMANDPQNAFYKSGSNCQPEDFIEYFEPEKQVCSQLKSSDTVRQIKIRGKCQRVSSMNIQQSCRYAKSAYLEPNFAIYQGGKCDHEDFVSLINSDVDCSNLRDLSFSTVYIKQGKQCLDAGTYYVRTACNQYKKIWDDADKLYTGQNCRSSNSKAMVDFGMDCSTFPNDNSSEIYSYSVQGSCYYYSWGTSQRSACRDYRKRIYEMPDMKFFFKDNDCKKSEILANLGKNKHCEDLREKSNGYEVKSVMLNKLCLNFRSKKNLLDICRNFPKDTRNSCRYANNGTCEDGRKGSQSSRCSPRTDEADCKSLADVFPGDPVDPVVDPPDEEISSCWQGCMDDNNSTKTCANRCGVKSETERVACKKYCKGRGGSSSLCTRLCR